MASHAKGTSQRDPASPDFDSNSIWDWRFGAACLLIYRLAGGRRAALLASAATVPDRRRRLTLSIAVFVCWQSASDQSGLVGRGRAFDRIRPVCRGRARDRVRPASRLWCHRREKAAMARFCDSGNAKASRQPSVAARILGVLPAARELGRESCEIHGAARRQSESTLATLDRIPF